MKEFLRALYGCLKTLLLSTELKKLDLRSVIVGGCFTMCVTSFVLMMLNGGLRAVFFFILYLVAAKLVYSSPSRDTSKDIRPSGSDPS